MGTPSFAICGIAVRERDSGRGAVWRAPAGGSKFKGNLTQKGSACLCVNSQIGVLQCFWYGSRRDGKALLQVVVQALTRIPARAQAKIRASGWKAQRSHQACIQRVVGWDEPSEERS